MALDRNRLHFETLQLHVGQETPDSSTGARAVPIYQTTSYVFENSAQAEARFALQDAGNIYGRLTNSTQEVLEKRIAALEGGVAALAVASGAAAITYALLNITRNGARFVFIQDIYNMQGQPVVTSKVSCVATRNGRLTRGDELAEAFKDYL